ncbi:MAG: glycosyltransferase family 4 protein [Flavobacteriales bacterium]|nr:glycosyltransferase family 4 protein [Flavobacteriales bacterium]MCB9193632.1 glycosyltransferase family 4 protein [Flavobacteriales bacterium]
MHVTYLTHYAELYGANRSLLDLLVELRDRGEVVPHVLLPREGPMTDRLSELRIAHRVLPFQPWMSERRYEGRAHHRIGQWWRYHRAARARAQRNRALLPVLADQTKAWDTDIVHANSSVVGVAADLSSEVLRPLVWHIRELPERHYFLHLDEGRGGYGRALRNADRLIAISEAVKADILHYTRPVRPIAVIYNGVLHRARYGELRRMAPARWSSTVPFIFAMVGLIHPSKGQLQAVDALAEVCRSGIDARMVIAGEGRDDALRQRITELGLEDRVELAGFVTDPYAVFEYAHALLMCSRNEAMGRVTVEAMAAGLPVIGHASGGTPELITDRTTGMLYTDGTGELAECMRLLATDPDQARKLGEQASLAAEERFSIEHYADEVLKVYHEVLSERRP